jgi:signal transduction histidine kinase
MLLGLGIASAVAVSVGFLVPGIVRADLVAGRALSIDAVVGDLVDKGLLASAAPSDSELAALDEAVRFKLLGGDVVRVKIWDRSGTVIYSDATPLIGQSFPPSMRMSSALAGQPSSGRSLLSGPDNEYERDLGQLVEHYVPVRSAQGEIIAVFEVYETAATLNAIVDSIRFHLAAAIALGLLVLVGFMLAVFVANARVITGRTRQVEDLLSRLARAYDEEQRRIVGALHDDIGPPLYRMYYGLQGIRSMLEPGDPIIDEVAGLEDLAGHVERTLRAELSLLHHGSAEHLTLDALLVELVDKANSDGALLVDLDVEQHASLTAAQRTVLLQVVTEAISNVRRHAEATRVSIRVSDGNGRILLDIQDDGRGIDELPGLGLTITRERLEAQGGRLIVSGVRGGGTLLRASVPVDEVPVR